MQQAPQISSQSPLSPPSIGRSQSFGSTDTAIERNIGAITGQVIATHLGQGIIFEKIHARPGTNVSGSEGDHITASAVLNEIVHNFLERKTPGVAIEQLPQLAKVIGFNDEQQSNIGKILQERKEFLENNHLTLKKDDRYKLTQDLRQIDFIANQLKGKDFDKLAGTLGLTGDNQKRFEELFDANQTLKEEQIVEIRELIKYGNRAANAATIAAISEEIINALNQQKDPPSALHKRRNPEGCHARDESGSIPNLISIDHF